VASRKRPVVFVVDDLQWAGRTPLGFIDLVLGEENLEGLLVVGAYREGDVDATHQLAAMLHLDAEKAAELANMIAPRTKGNPYDTVELLNALRRDGVLVPGDAGWQWDTAALQRLGAGGCVADLLAERAGAMPPATLTMLEAMACVGGRVEVSLLSDATGQPTAEVEERLVPALDDGLLVMEPGLEEAVRFRHDRVQEAVLQRLGPDPQRALRLRLARQLARRAELFAVAAQQYLPVVEAVQEPQERRQVAGLLRRAASQAQLLSNYPVVDRLLAAAVTLCTGGLTRPRRPMI
jgi:predicted ATPase